MFRKWLITKYGEISQKIFDNELKERRKWLINYLTNIDKSLPCYTFENLSNNDLNIAFWKKSEEIQKAVNSEEFQKIWKELTGE